MRRNRTASALAFASTLALLLPACYGDVLDTGADADERVETPPLRDISSELQALPAADLFALAAVDWDVPRDLLVAITWHESSFAPGDEDHAEHRPADGWMGLTPDRVAQASAWTGYSQDDIRHTREANVFAGAAVLDALRDELAPDAAGSVADAAWWPVVVAWSDFDLDWMSHDFAFDVFRTLQTGLGVPTVSGDVVSIEPRELPGLQDVPFIRPPGRESGSFHATTGYPGAARFVAAHSSNQSYRSNGLSSINRVVIHTTEGSYNGSISWYQNSSSNVSAHYTLRKSDGEITQSVSDDRRAWHACSNNNDTVGLEHEGASSNAATWTPQLLDASARLTAWLVTQYNIPLDRDHIVGHGEIQPSSCAYRYDPGPYFPWDQYMNMVAGYANPTPEPPETPDPPEDPETPPETPPSETGTVTFQTPGNGDVVGNPVIMRVARSGGQSIELWSGPAQLTAAATGNPVNVGYLFSSEGTKTVTARLLSPAGAVLATDSVTVDVQNVYQLVEPSGGSIDGMTWRMNTSSNAAAHSVSYWVDGWPLRDVNTSSYDAVGAPYSLDYTFGYAAANRLLQARAYDAAGGLLGEGFTYIDVSASGTPTPSGGSIDDVVTTEAGGTLMRFVTDVTGAVARVEYWVDGWRLPDAFTGQHFGIPSDFELWYEFNYTGERTLETRALDAAGNLLDSDVRLILVPSDDLSVTWTRTGSMHYLFDAAAPAGTERVVIEIDDWALPDVNTGASHTVGPDFGLEYHFSYAGLRSLHAFAYDAFGNTLSDYVTTIQVY